MWFDPGGCGPRPGFLAGSSRVSPQKAQGPSVGTGQAAVESHRRHRVLYDQYPSQCCRNHTGRERDTSSKVTVERYNAPDGKKLKHKAWSRKQGSKRLHVLSFDGLGFGENTIGISLNVPKNPELSKTYNVTITRAETLGSDATLTALGLSQSGLTPVFASDTKSYTADVPYRVTSLGITVQRKQAGTAIRLRGTASDGTGLVVEEMTASGLTVGRNMIEILATAEDGSMTESYTVAVLRLVPSKDTKLRDLSLAEGPAGFFGLDIPTGGGILRPAFSPDTRSYEASVPSHVIAVKMAILSQTISALRQSGETGRRHGPGGSDSRPHFRQHEAWRYHGARPSAQDRYVLWLAGGREHDRDSSDSGRWGDDRCLQGDSDT